MAAGANTNAFILDMPTSLFSGNTYGVDGGPFLEFEALGGGAYSLDVVYNATPEPGTMMLVLAGAVPMLTARRRRRRQADQTL